MRDVHDPRSSPPPCGVSGDLDAVVARARQGDVEAFSELVEASWARLVRFARTVVGDADAEDVVQDGLVVAWRKLGSLREPAAFPSWILRVVARFCIHHSRRRRPLVALGEAEEPAERVAPGWEAAIDVERALAVLAPRQRAVMYLTAVEGMSDSEIGSSLGIAAGSVRAHRRRARDRLAAVLGSATSRAGGVSPRRGAATEWTRTTSTGGES